MRPDSISSFSRSFGVIETYLPFWTSYPRTMSSHFTSLRHFGHVRLNWRGLLQVGHIIRRVDLCSEMAPYVLTGILTSPKLMAAFQIDRGGRTLDRGDCSGVLSKIRGLSTPRLAYE